MIQLRLFGTPELRNGKGTDLQSVLSHAKHLALLAYVAVSRNGAHRRDRLTALLWPDLDDPRARNALSKALHHLRRVLGEDVLVSEGNETIAVNFNVLWCDVDAFETAIAAGDHRTALDWYRRGELLEGLSLMECVGFDHWVDQQRSRLDQMALRSAAALADQAEQAGDLSGAQTWASLACEIAPHDETTFQRYLTLLNRSGNRSAALSAYQRFSRRIAEDLDAAPSEATRSLVESVQGSGSGVSRAGNGITPIENGGPEQSLVEAVVENGAVRSKEPKTRVRRRYLVAAIALAMIGAAGGTIYLRNVRPQSSLVAVGMLRNRTGNTGLNPFADIATGSILQHLAQNGQVDVVDLRRVPGPGPAGGDTLQIPAAQSQRLAREAGAGKLVTGDIYSKGDSLLIQMQIVSAADGHVIQQLDPVMSPAANAYLLLDRLREGVTGAVTALADTLYLPWSTAHSRPPKYAAFQEFMQGLDAIVHTGVTPAVEHLRRAVTLDTGFVEAKIWLLEQVSMMPDQDAYVDSISRAALAQRSSLGAFDQVSLDRELAFLAGHWEAAYDASRRLVQIAPSTQDAQVYRAQSAMATRRYAEALDVLHKIDLTKGWLKDLPQLWEWDLQAHRLSGDAKGGLKEWRQLRARLPKDYGACAAGMPLMAMTGREADVDALLGECAAMSGAPATIDRQLEIAGRVYRRAGFSNPARRAFERALVIRAAAASAAAGDFRRMRRVADLHCELGNWNQAYDILRQAADTSDVDYQTKLGVVAAHVGDTSAVNKSLRWIEGWGRRSRATGQDKMDRAFVLLASGDREAALRLLKQSMAEGVAPPWNAWYVRYEVSPLRGDPRFEEMIAPRS